MPWIPIAKSRSSNFATADSDRLMSSERARRLRFSYRIPGRSYDISAAVVVTFTAYYIHLLRLITFTAFLEEVTVLQ